MSSGSGAISGSGTFSRKSIAASARRPIPTSATPTPRMPRIPLHDTSGVHSSVGAGGSTSSLSSDSSGVPASSGSWVSSVPFESSVGCGSAGGTISVEASEPASAGVVGVSSRTPLASSQSQEESSKVSGQPHGSGALFSHSISGTVVIGSGAATLCGWVFGTISSAGTTFCSVSGSTGGAGFGEDSGCGHSRGSTAAGSVSSFGGVSCSPGASGAEGWLGAEGPDGCVGESGVAGAAGEAGWVGGAGCSGEVGSHGSGLGCGQGCELSSRPHSGAGGVSGNSRSHTSLQRFSNSQ